MQETPRYLTVSELAATLNMVLEETLPTVHFIGEISQVTLAASGHLYIVLKDAESQLSAAMWRASAIQLKFKPVAGLAVQCVGRPNLYNKSGKLQILLRTMELAGEGALQKRFLELKKRLTAEGYFAPERKRPLPFLPRAIGIVSSATGAVIHDMMVKIRERMPNLVVYLVDVRVQGLGAADEIAAAIGRLSKEPQIETIIVARGGGSLEDLWAFNEEVVVKAIFASRVPVISGVGHEVDVTLADYVADLRAPTPTAAAEMVVPKRSDLLAGIAELERRLKDLDHWFFPVVQGLDEVSLRFTRALLSQVDQRKLQLATALAQLRSLQPRALLDNSRAKLNALDERLVTSLQGVIMIASRSLDLMRVQLQRGFSTERVLLARQTLDAREGALINALRTQIEIAKHRVSFTATRLTAVSPLAVLGRGYAVVEARGKVVSSSDQVAIGDQVSIRLREGGLTTQVIANRY